MKQAGATVFPVGIPQVASALVDAQPMSVSEFESKWNMDEYFASLGPKGKFHIRA